LCAHSNDPLRCFPHVINLAVGAFLTALSKIPTAGGSGVWWALGGDPVAQARTLVTACRSSGQRREALVRIIKAGNEAHDWGNVDDEEFELRVVGLLKDVDTRWSSTFLMIDRLLEQYPAIERLLDEYEETDLGSKRLSAATRKVLADIRDFLLLLHSVQEIVSAEKTPTLSIVLPIYEQLIQMLRDFAQQHPKLRVGINAAVKKINEYLGKSRRTQVYALAMSESLFPSLFFHGVSHEYD
ncbi:ribonuclease H-like domain-containing protein, partial [Roridomyces roridus]